MKLREILVRGYAKEELSTNSQWIEGFGAAEVRMTDGTSDYILYTPYGHYEVCEGSVGEFTGLYDINSKKIFEGDKVKFKVWDHTWIEGYGIVYFDKGCFRLNDNHALCDYMRIEGIVEVVGNTYEESIL